MNNEPQDIEELLKAIKNENARSLVAKYLGKEQISQDERHEASQIVKNLLVEYPEFKAYFNPEPAEESAKDITNRFKEYHKKVSSLIDEYQTLLKYICDCRCLYRYCCETVHYSFINALEHKERILSGVTLPQLNYTIKHGLETESHRYRLPQTDTDSDWTEHIKEYENDLKQLKQRYTANKFSKQPGPILKLLEEIFPFLDWHHPEKHVYPPPILDRESDYR